MQLRYSFRLYPDPRQQAALARAFGCARVVFNDVLRAREDARQTARPFPTAGQLSRTLITEAKQTAGRAWLTEVSAVVLQQSLRDAETAYRNFFASLTGTRKAPVPEADRSPAADLLTRLRLHDSRLLLTERDVRRLAPAVSVWLERGVPASAVERTLTAGLPREPIRHPVAFLDRRLTADLPPALPAPLPVLHPQTPGRRLPDPLQTCDGCERAFRASRPGRCRDCRPAPAATRAAA